MTNTEPVPSFRSLNAFKKYAQKITANATGVYVTRYVLDGETHYAFFDTDRLAVLDSETPKSYNAAVIFYSTADGGSEDFGYQEFAHVDGDEHIFCDAVSPDYKTDSPVWSAELATGHYLLIRNDGGTWKAWTSGDEHIPLKLEKLTP